MTQIFLFLLITTICLCLCINSFLIGTIKNQIFVIANILALILIGLAFYLYDMKIGCLAIIVYIGARILFKPLGAHIAAWLLRKAFHVEGKYIGLPPSKLNKISENIVAHINRPISVESLLDKEDPVKNLIDYCYSLPKIAEILALHEFSKEQLLELYRSIMLYGGAQWVGGHFIAASSLAFPEPLNYFLEYGVTQKTVFDALMYFERGIPLGILKIQE